MKADLHMHPLNHRYYDGYSLPHNVKTLTDMDKQRIREMMDWNVKRGLDICSITDHDMVLPSLYAMEYAKEKNLPIKVISGMEIELHCDYERVHLCAWGIKDQPKYSHATPVDEVTKVIHDMGGKIIMNHPMFSPKAFEKYYKHIDGYEVINSDKHTFEEGMEYLRKVGHTLICYANSDYHYSPMSMNLPEDPKYFPKYINDVSEKWLKQFGG